MLARLFQRRILLSLLAVMLAAYGIERLARVTHGLVATYLDRPDWSRDAAAGSFVDDPPSTSLLQLRRPDFVDHPFSVEWQGFIAILGSGTYTFRTVSDDGSWLTLQGQEVVSNGGEHASSAADGTVALARGVLPIDIRYFQSRGDVVFELWWSRNGGDFEPVPSWALLSRQESYARVLASRIAPGVFIVAAIATYLAFAAAFLRLAARTWRRVVDPGGRLADPAFRWVLIVSTALNVWGLWWALPNLRGWAPDELVPSDVLDAVRVGFSHGWGWKYPAFHYMVLGAADSPMLVLSWLGLVDLDAVGPHFALALIGRFVSVLCGAGTIVLVHRCGLELYGRRGAMFAALTMALTLPFSYHSKIATLDVPYLFWFAASLLAYVRILKSHERRDYLLFAVAATLAGCTKDQAWGLCALVPAAILVARWHRWQKGDGPWRSLVFDGTTVRALALGAATFLLADNVVFNFAGFMHHVQTVFGMPGSLDLHAFPATIAGELRMAWRTVGELQLMFGWPLALIVAAALARGLWGQTTTPSLRWLVVPVGSYYAVFLAAVLFVVDRYLMPITLVLALFAGWWLERVLAPGAAWRRARVALVLSAFAYSVVYVAAADYQMTTDSRYAVTRWLRDHVRPDQVIGSVGPLEYFALADGFAWQSIESPADLANARPAFVVVSLDQIPKSSASAQALHDALHDRQSGYRLVLTWRAPWLPLPGLHPDLGAAPRRGLKDFSDLNMINPTMEVFERADLRIEAPTTDAGPKTATISSVPTAPGETLRRREDTRNRKQRPAGT